MTEARRPKIHVLYPEHSAYIGGGQTYLISLLKNLDRERFEPVVTVVTDGKLRETIDRLGVRTEVIDMRWVLRKSPLATAGNLRDFYGLVKKCRTQVVHCNSQKALLVAGPPARAAGARLIWHSHVPSGLGKVFDLMGCALAHRIVVNSNVVRLRFERWPRCRRAPSLVPYGIDTEKFGPPLNGMDCRREFGIAAADPVVGYVGRLEEEKGIRFFVEAIPRVAEAVPSATFLIVGEASDEQVQFGGTIRAMVSEMGISGRVVFTGFRSDVPDLIAAMDLVVVPSLREAFGQVNVEVMASGKPLVATTAGGIPEVVEAGVTGILVPPADSGAIEGAVISLLRDPEKCRAMGEAGRNRATRVFDIRKHVRVMEEIYTEMAASHE